MEWGRLAILLAVVVVLVVAAVVYIVRHPAPPGSADIDEPRVDKHAAERFREWERWRRGGPLYQDSVACSHLPPFARQARGLPAEHDERLFHD